MPDSDPASKMFYTVRETAVLLRVDTSTLYRAIRENAFPAVKIRSRYVVPAKALDRLVVQATTDGGLVDPAAMAVERRTEAELRRNGW
jgi:excisionase family DNA binding protein